MVIKNRRWHANSRKYALAHVIHDGDCANENDGGVVGRCWVKIVCDGARQMLAAVLKAEVADEVDKNGHRLVAATVITTSERSSPLRVRSR